MDQTVTVDSWEELGIYPGGPSGMEYRTICPLCTPNRKPEHRKERDFSISKDREKGYCHHCGGTVNIRTRGHSEPLAHEFTFTPVSARKQEYERPQPRTDSEVHKAHWRKFFQDRALDFDAIAAEFHLTVSADGTLSMPYYNAEGELINHKHRAMGEKRFWMDAGAERGFYNLHEVVGADVIVIVEGEMDVYAVWEAGMPHVISVPDGAPAPNAKNYSSKFDFMDAAKDILASASRIILAVDEDEPGAHLREELKRRIGEERVAHVHWPEGTKDANDYLMTFGPQKLKAEILKAQPTPVTGVFTGEDLWHEIAHAMQYGYDRGTPIGFPALDDIYRPTRGHFTIVTGHAGSGKSTVLDNLLVRLATLQNWPIAYFSPEQQPMSRHMANLIEIYLRRPLFPRDGVHPDDLITLEEARGANEFLSELISFINPEGVEQDPSLERILALATSEVYRRGIKGLVIDPWNEIQHGRPKHLSETEYVSQALQQIRSWGRRYGVHVWLIAHPTKMQKEDGKDAVPGLSNISGSVNFRNKADYGLTVYRDQQATNPDTRNIVEIHVTKARWRDSAKAGEKAIFLFDHKTNTISEPRPW